MQKNRITPLQSADATNPFILGKLESLSSIPRSLNASLSQLSFRSTGSLSKSISSMKHPNESRAIVKNYVAPTNATKRHGSDIKVIFHADQLADKWENILPLTLGSVKNNELVEFQNPQTCELQKSPLPFESNFDETPINDENTREDFIYSSANDLVDRILINVQEEVVQLKEDFIYSSANDLVEGILIKVQEEVVQLKEDIIRKSAEFLVEDILIDLLLHHSGINGNDPAPGVLNHELTENVIEIDMKEGSSNIESAGILGSPCFLTQGAHIPQSESDIKMEINNNSSSHALTKSDESYEFDTEEMERNEQELQAKKIIERTSKMIDIADQKEDEGLEEGTSYRNMGLNVSHNYSELRDSVIFKGKRYSIKLNHESISCVDLDRKYAFYFPIMLRDVLSATYSAGGNEKGPKLRCIQLKFDSDAQTELWASTIIKRKWQERLKTVSEKQALILVDTRSPDLFKVVKKYVCTIFECTGKLYTLKGKTNEFDKPEIEISDTIKEVSSILESEAKLYDTIALFANQSSNIKDILQKTVNDFFGNAHYLDHQDNEAMDAVYCASLLLNSKSEESNVIVMCCPVKRDKGLVQKIIGQFSSQDRKSIIHIAK